MSTAQHRQSRNPDPAFLTTVPQFRITSFPAGKSILVPNSNKIRPFPAPNTLDSQNLHKPKGTGVLQRTRDSGETSRLQEVGAVMYT